MIGFPKGQSRLQRNEAVRKLQVVTDRDFRRDVWTRDRFCCRWCGCRVQKTLQRVVDRGEVHHLHGRLGALRHETRCAILVCAECHELLTGKVSQRWIVVGTVCWDLEGRSLIDARERVTFERVA